MSQLGGNIQTVDAPEVLGAPDVLGAPFDKVKTTDRVSGQKYFPKLHHDPTKSYRGDDQIVYPMVGPGNTPWPDTSEETKAAHAANHAQGHDAGHAAPGSSPIRAPRYERVVYTPQPNNIYSANLRDKNPLNTYTYSSWPTHWPDGTPRKELLPVNWDPSTTTVHNKPLKSPYDPYRRRQKLQAGHGQYHTHWADGSERKNKLDPARQNPGTHDDRGRRVRPANYDPSTHFSNFKLKPVYDPDRPKKNPSPPEQHTQHEHAEIRKLQEKVKELQKSNQQKDNQIKQAKEAKAATAVKHALLRQQQSEIKPTTQGHIRAISATRGTSTSRPATTAAAGAARDRSRSRAKTPVRTQADIAAEKASIAFRPTVKRGTVYRVDKTRAPVEYVEPYLHDGGSGRSGRRRGGRGGGDGF